MGNNKISKKKLLMPKLVKIPPEVQAKIDEEYEAEYQKHLKEIKERLGDDFKGMYARWFDEDMWHEYCFIRDKHMQEYKNRKNMKNQQEKE